MNDTADSSHYGSKYLGGSGLSFGISAGVLVLMMAVIAIASYFWSCKCKRGDPTHEGSISTDDPDSVVIEVGIDEATFLSYPKLLFSEAKLQKGDSIPSCCSICLADYDDADMLRLLPDCDHFFHAKCVDPWLKTHSTCPVCRSSPIPPPKVAPGPTERASFTLCLPPIIFLV